MIKVIKRIIPNRLNPLVVLITKNTRPLILLTLR